MEETAMIMVNDCPISDCYFQAEMKICPYNNHPGLCPKMEAKQQGVQHACDVRREG